MEIDNIQRISATLFCMFLDNYTLGRLYRLTPSWVQTMNWSPSIIVITCLWCQGECEITGRPQHIYHGAQCPLLCMDLRQLTNKYLRRWFWKKHSRGDDTSCSTDTLDKLTVLYNAMQLSSGLFYFECKNVYTEIFQDQAIPIMSFVRYPKFCIMGPHFFRLVQKKKYHFVIRNTIC